jgi:hypothetical protein
MFFKFFKPNKLEEEVEEEKIPMATVINNIFKELIKELPNITEEKTLKLREEDVKAVFDRALAKFNGQIEKEKGNREKKVENWKKCQMNSSITQLLPKFEPLIKAINDLYEAEESWKNAWEKEHPDQESNA